MIFIFINLNFVILQLNAIQNHGQQIVDSEHFEAPKVVKVMEEVTLRRENIKEQSATRHKNLDNSMLYAQFNRDVVEVMLKFLFVAILVSIFDLSIFYS